MLNATNRQQALEQAEILDKAARVERSVDKRIAAAEKLGYEVMMKPRNPFKQNVRGMVENHKKKKITINLSGSMGYSGQYWIYYVEIYYD